jgi:hypothetical protein
MMHPPRFTQRLRSLAKAEADMGARDPEPVNAEAGRETDTPETENASHPHVLKIQHNSVDPATTHEITVREPYSKRRSTLK